MDVLISNGVAIFIALLSSSGMWAYFKSRDQRRDATTALLLGLAHDRIVSLGMSYINRGWVSRDEYEDFMKYLYSPYSKFGGNGLAEKIAADITTLPFERPTPSNSRIRRDSLR